jgi:uncharacterized protein (TIGR03000 family)
MALFRPPLASLALLGFFLPAVRADDVPGNKAIIKVRLPANAVVTIDSYPTQQTGAERSYITPPLTPGKEYSYTLQATWMAGGQARNVVRKVPVRAGQVTEVDLTREEPAARVSPPPLPVEPDPIEPKLTKPKGRTFLFTYSVALTGLADKAARVWLPVPSASDEQDIDIADKSSLPAGCKIAREPIYGNQLLYADLKGDKDGNASLAVTYKVVRREVVGPSNPDVPDARLIARYLEPDKLVPIEGKPLELIKGKPVPIDQLVAGKMFYDVVNAHMRYSKEGTGWGRGDSVWACDSKYGNCTDFHSLFISLARAHKIPAKFEIGFPLPPARGEGEIGGYHCWAYFKPEGRGWVAVDISEANKEPKLKDYYFGKLTEDRVTFSTGRDFDLVPKQDGERRNFFIYPYVEVDGKELPAQQVKRQFRFKDVP